MTTCQACRHEITGEPHKRIRRFKFQGKWAGTTEYRCQKCGKERDYLDKLGKEMSSGFNAIMKAAEGEWK